MEGFYERLDELYAAGDQAAVEEFLLTHTRGEGPTVVSAWNELGSLYRGSGRYEQSVHAFTQAMTMTGALLGEDDPAYATVLNNLAGTYRLMGDHAGARVLFFRAMELYDRAGEKGFPYISAINNLALVHLDEEDYLTAADYLEKALAALSPYPGHRREVAITHRNLAYAYRQLGDEEKVSLHLERAQVLEGEARG